LLPNTSKKYNENLHTNIKASEARLSYNPDKSLCKKERFNQMAKSSSGFVDMKAETAQLGIILCTLYIRYIINYIIMWVHVWKKLITSPVPPIYKGLVAMDRAVHLYQLLVKFNYLHVTSYKPDFNKYFLRIFSYMFIFINYTLYLNNLLLIIIHRKYTWIMLYQVEGMLLMYLLLVGIIFLIALL
jgi:hypothetical protein